MVIFSNLLSLYDVDHYETQQPKNNTYFEDMTWMIHKLISKVNQYKAQTLPKCIKYLTTNQNNISDGIFQILFSSTVGVDRIRVKSN